MRTRSASCFASRPTSHRDEPAYFTQHLRVPPLEEDAKGDAYLQGAFDIGEGSYHIDWLMRDRTERVCSSNWDSEAALGVQGSADESGHRSRSHPARRR